MTPPHTAVNDVKPYIRNVPKGMVMLLTVEWPLVVQKKTHLPTAVDVGIFFGVTYCCFVWLFLYWLLFDSDVL